MKKWREAASLILISRNTLCNKSKVQSKVNVDIGVRKCDTQNHQQLQERGVTNYKVMMLKRSSKSGFMPKAYVFPGGRESDVDSLDLWLDLFQDANVTNFNNLKIYQNKDERSPMLISSEEAKENIVFEDIVYRICAIRETFEESGILLYRPKNSLKEMNTNDIKYSVVKDSSYVPANSLDQWRLEVEKSDDNFFHMCKELEIVPDIWALAEWSNWLTPTHLLDKNGNSSRRFDTMFYVTFLDEEQEAKIDDKEITSMQWFEPENILQLFKERKEWISTPQIYELLRFCNFQDFDKLHTFSKERASKGCERMLNIRITCDDGEISVLPGDDLYPDNPDIYGEGEQLRLKGTMKEMLKKSTNYNRLEFKSLYEVNLRSNTIPKHGQLVPVNMEFKQK